MILPRLSRRLALECVSSRELLVRCPDHGAGAWFELVGLASVPAELDGVLREGW